MIRDGLNTFYIKEGSTTYTITIPIGNYTLSEFLTGIQAVLIPPYTGFTYVITFSKRLGKLIFTVSGNFAVQPQFIFTTNVFETFGFDKNSSNIFVGNTITSTNIINLNPNEMIYICSDMCNNAENQILEAIPMSNISDYSYQYYQNTSTHTLKELTNNRNTIFNFQIKDSFHRLLDLNGKNIVFTICCHKEIESLNHGTGLTAGTDKIETEQNLDKTDYTIGFE